MTAKRAAFPSLLARLGSPLEWSAAGKCLFGSLVMFCFNFWYWIDVYYALSYPNVAPYLDRSVLAFTFRVQLGLLAWWLFLASVALWLQGHARDSRALVHVALHSGSVNVCVGAYITGFYTSLLTGVAALGGSAVILILFEARIVVPAIVSLVLLSVGITVAERVELIPYAPLLAEAPFEDGRLSGWWLASVGTSTFVVFLTSVSLVYLMVERWRDREARLAETSEQLSRANELISRYVAAQVARHILAGDYAAIEKRMRRTLTLFFSDIRGFTDIAERADPEDLSTALNEYLSEMTDIADRYGATVDKFVGDAIMIFFGAPSATNDEDHALRAVRMAVEMQERMVGLRQRWVNSGFDDPFAIRIGINTGVASVGNFGSKGRVDYTAIGRQVNLAARLQVSCAPGKVLLSHSTWALVREHVPCVRKGEIRLRGIRRPVEAYEVLAGNPLA